MSGEVICELRRAYSHNKSVTINSTAAHLTVVPPQVLKDAKNRTDYRRTRIHRGPANLECHPNKTVSFLFIFFTIQNMEFLRIKIAGAVFIFLN